MAKVEDGQIVESAVAARGARRGTPVLYVLIGGVTGVVVLFTIVYVFFFS